ncbi:MAG: hypothetical protein ABIQ95_08475, partial [Bdellovibrionia bacterium]
MKLFVKLRKLLKWLGFALIANILVVSIALIVLLANPDWLVNERALHFLANIAREKQIVDVHWDQASAHVQSKFLKPEAFNFSFKNLCVATAEKEQEACWKTADLSFKVGFSGFKPKLTEVGPVRLMAGQVTFTPSKQPKPAEQPVSLSDRLSTVSTFLSLIREISIHSIYVSVHHEQAKVIFEGDNGKFNIASDLKVKRWPLDDGQFLNGGLHLTVVAKENRARIEAKMSGKVSGKGLKREKAVSASLNGDILDLKNLDQIKLKADGTGRYLVPQVSQMGLRNCTADIHKIKSGSFLGNVKIACPLWVELPTVLEEKYKLNFPPRALFKFNSDFDSSEYPLSPASKLKGSANLEVDPLSAPWLKGQAKMEVNFEGVPAKFPNGWKAESDLAINAKVPRFEALVENFSRTPWAVPAPFHVLVGRVDLDVHGKSDLNQGSFPIILKTRLKSEHQKLNLDGKGSLTVTNIQSGPQSKMAFNLSLSDVDLELPKLDLSAPPRVMPEKRFNLSEKTHTEPVVTSKSEFGYDLQIETPGDRPMKILSNLAKSPIPIHVQLFLNSDYVTKGFIRVKDFPMEVFRRNASLDHFDVTLKSPAAESTIDGLINVKYVDYTVSILVTSTVGKPAIKLISDPPLPEDKLVATLLFG